MESTDTLHVLIVEEDPRTRDLLRVGLDSFANFVVDSAEPGWAVDEVRDRRFDLVIVNLEMGDGLDGLDVVRSIRELDSRPEFILLTKGKSSRFLSSQKNANNIFAFLTLPLDVAAFFKTIARARDRIRGKVAAGR
jgi:DNA-binding response OmpR family regulator